MEDIFDFTIDDKSSELELANQDWSKKMHDVALNGEREAFSEGFEIRLADVFGKGLNTGFELMKDLGILEGRLLFLKSKCSDETLFKKLLSSLKTIEADVIREISLNTRYSNLSDQKIFPSEYIANINVIKNELNDFLKSCK